MAKFEMGEGFKPRPGLEVLKNGTDQHPENLYSVTLRRRDCHNSSTQYDRRLASEWRVTQWIENFQRLVRAGLPAS